MTHPQPFFVPARQQTAAPILSAELALTLLGPSAAMSQLWSQLRRLAPHVRTVLLTGEPDCGQEAVARLLLDLSPQPKRPFLSLSAEDAEQRLTRGIHASIPPEVFLYLPDVHRLSTAAQDGLLRLVRTRRSRSLAIIAATKEDLRAMVSTGRFSPELAEYLGSVRLTVPALRNRREDVPMLINQMLAARLQGTGESVPQVTEDLLRAAMQHNWPGNLRELSSAVEYVLSEVREGSELSGADLHRALASSQQPQSHEPAPVRMVPLDAIVQEHIYAVLRGCRGNKLRAAEVLGISRSTLYRMLDASPQDLPFSMAS